MDALARLLARDEIRELAHRYAVAIDSRDLDALVALFVDDVRVGRDGARRCAATSSGSCARSASRSSSWATT